jgi:hypothetical protein
LEAGFATSKVLGVFMATLPSNNLKYMLMTAGIDFGADTFKIILMKAGFAFNRATHDTYSDVSTDELATGGGYTVGGQTLAGGTLTRDDGANVTVATWNNPSWLAAGGDIVTQGAILFDDTLASKPVVGFIDFGSALTTYAGGTFTIANPLVEI